MIDPLRGSGLNGSGLNGDDKDDAWLRWVNRWEDVSEWMRLPSILNCCWTPGCIILFLSILFISGFVLGYVVGGKH
jgi:hypothetical protein